ncbi:STAS domain-containing protein [Streptomyces sp. ICBB 8177]|uniref:STAS domain-containing protein n=1 Tax=Streptomyces sp. ICBB 8177 TaxID=563922 RepID=UPI000D67D7D5|nr:STAS domain-containing protein [Streptomyces sp. ICBB 8177]PWI42840.1 anti-anti-sigma factor [Streptomyces sp. ICBB 8177]
MSQVSFAVRRGGGGAGPVVLALTGDIDRDESVVLAEAAASVGEGDRDLRVDLSGVRFMDSSGLHFLVALRNEAEARGARFSLSGVRPQAARLVRLVGLEDFLGLPPETRSA